MIDSVVGTAGEPAKFRRASSGWLVSGDSIMVVWSFGMENILVSARLNDYAFVGHSRHGSDFGGGGAAAVSAERIACTDTIEWVRASPSGGRR
jgi:hypothetical protein